MGGQKNHIHPVILSGGAGTRLWPLSRSAYPKQFLKLVDDHSLLQQTCLRLNAPMFNAPSISCNHEHRFLVAEQLHELEIVPEQIVLEPCVRNTAPAALIAALIAYDKEPCSLILLMPSDHIIHDNEGFQRSIKRAIDAAVAGAIVTFGVRPDAPETGFGYIETAGHCGQIEHVLNTSRFIEKPTASKAEEYVRDEKFLWNSGLFLFAAETLVASFEKNAPDILDHCRAALHEARLDLDFLRLEQTAYERCEDISLDYAIIEKAQNIKCVPLDTGWSDLGAWSSIWSHMDKDAHGNVMRGDVILHDVNNSYVHSAGDACLTMVGLDNVMAVATRDAILITTKDRAEDVKHIVHQLKAQSRKEVVDHMRVYRPWGWYEGLNHGQRFQVKSLMVKPGAQLSLQSHAYRAEHWVVVEGMAKVTVGEKVSILSENQSTYIPIGAIHRLANPGNKPARLIEVQSGTYLGEDDIIRHDDDFGRELSP